MTQAGSHGHTEPSVALIGLRGSGKTAVGRELATLTGREHVDTDDVIVRQAGRSIADIFEAEGEAGFRRREREIIARVVQGPPTVLSVGGGAILDEENVRLLRGAATIVWLTAPVDVLWERIANDTATASARPALTDRSGIEELEHLLSERAPCYRRAADLAVDTTGGRPREVATQIAARLQIAR